MLNSLNRRTPKPPFSCLEQIEFQFIQDIFLTSHFALEKTVKVDSIEDMKHVCRAGQSVSSVGFQTQSPNPTETMGDNTSPLPVLLRHRLRWMTGLKVFWVNGWVSPVNINKPLCKQKSRKIQNFKKYPKLLKGFSDKKIREKRKEK